ncbi:MAG: PIG-L family deacetylase [Myxococcales bacterium]|nr:PIG-L family deacetylase [Myxococcales bacterium]MCB9519717.1 PIG-L family deacetylase [Myxococcales bacterium]MCB9530408.1 PIG-L family deacetylase [Myxococcales bacterium]MCB9533655.1 PIG-L family deacetylase [Myxococcales bacterium]
MSIQNAQTVTVFAPHPDDETLGCGGTLLALRARGVELTWVIATDMDPAMYSPERVERREREIAACAAALDATVVRLGFTSARLDQVPTSSLVRAVADVVGSLRPDTVLTPFRGDAHSDHAALGDAVLAATKPMRAPSVRRVWAYEVPSETEIGWREPSGFRPNAFVDISEMLPRKLDLLDVWGEEIGEFPHPRSREAVEAWARVRGTTTGCRAAEAFMVVRERVNFEES